MMLEAKKCFFMTSIFFFAEKYLEIFYVLKNLKKANLLQTIRKNFFKSEVFIFPKSEKKNPRKKMANGLNSILMQKSCVAYFKKFDEQ